MFRAAINARFSRRTLIRLASAAAAGATIGTGAAAEPPEPPIIDTHQHLWDLERFRLPWLDGAGPILNRTHTPADYLKAADGLGVAKAVYMEVDVAPDQRGAEADNILESCRRTAGAGPAQTVAAVIGGAPERDDFPRYIARFKNNPYLKGVRSSFDAGLASDHFRKNLQLLGTLGLCYDINTGPPKLARAAQVAADCPDTRLVLDHCGNLDAAAPPAVRTQWQDGIARLAEHKNVVCKISGVLEAAASGKAASGKGSPVKAGPEEYAAVINSCLDRFGPDRVLFASNWPVVNIAGSFAKWVALVRTVTRPRPASDRRKLFYDNAQRFYALP